MTALERESVATNVLNITHDDAHVNQRDIPDSDATYFWEAGRGGGAVIVGADGSLLFSSSSISFDAHVTAYEQVYRTDPDDFTTAVAGT